MRSFSHLEIPAPPIPCWSKGDFSQQNLAFVIRLKINPSLFWRNLSGLQPPLLLIKMQLNPIIHGWTPLNAKTLVIKTPYVSKFHFTMPSFSFAPPRYLPLLVRPHWHVVVGAAAAPVVSHRWGYALLPGSCRPVEVRNLAPNLVAAGSGKKSFSGEIMLKMKKRTERM